MKTYAERIKALEERIMGSKDLIVEATKSAETEDRDLSDEEMASIDLAKSNIDTATKNIETLKAAEEALGAKIKAPTVIKSHKLGDGGDRPLADLFVKSATANLIAHVTNSRIEDVANNVYAKDAQASEFIKAGIDPANTTATGWATELTQIQYGEFLEALRPVSFYAQLAALGTTIPFGSANSVTFPAEGTTGGLAGSFVGEGHLIPVGQANYSQVIMQRYKMGVMSNFTREIIRSSTPAIETLVRSAIVADTATAIDTALISNNAAVTGVSPAGLMNGVTATASAGVTVANIVTDIKALVSPILAAGGNGSNITLLMNDEHLLGLSTVTTAAGTFAFKAEVASGTLLGYKIIASRTIAKGTVIAVQADSFASSYDTPEFETSNSAVIVQASNTGAKPVTGDYENLDDAAKDSTNNPNITTAFQQDLIVLRMVMPLSWGMRRTGMVTALSAVGW